MMISGKLTMMISGKLTTSEIEIMLAELGRIRGTMEIRIDEHGDMISRGVFPATLHAFTVSWPGNQMQLQGHSMIYEWNMEWDQYIGSVTQRKALAALTGGRLPNELYQAEALLIPLRATVPPNGGAIDGPFLLSTHRAICTRAQLKACLMKLTRSRLNILLHSSLVREIKLSNLT